MQTIFFHPDAEVCRAMEDMTRACEAVTVLCASYEELHEAGLSREGIVVTPGNGFGIMDGGFDGVLRRIHGDGLQERIQRGILRMYGPEMPVGTAMTAQAPDGQRIIYAPTMQVPMILEHSDCVYRAARAAAHLAMTMDEKTLYMPVMGSGTGGMTIEDAVCQMVAGVRDGTMRLTHEEMTWAHADRMHMQWHRFCGVPDDGFRFAAYFKEEDESDGDALDHPADGRS